MASLIIIALILIILIFFNKNLFALYLLNYFLGVILIILLPLFSKDHVYLGQGGAGIKGMYEILYFSIFFLMSISYLFLDKTNRKKVYYIIPICAYLLIIAYIFQRKDYEFWAHIFFAFFPTHIYSYFKLKNMGKM